MQSFGETKLLKVLESESINLNKEKGLIHFFSCEYI